MSDLREMPEAHRAVLYTSIGLKGHEGLPPKLEEKYWELKRIFDRTGTLIRAADLAIVCWQLGYGKPTVQELAPPTVVQLWRKKQIKVDEPIVAKWRNKWCDALLKGVTPNDEVVVLVIGEVDEQRLKVDDVKLPAA